jgi:hypothetical protein
VGVRIGGVSVHGCLPGSGLRAEGCGVWGWEEGIPELRVRVYGWPWRRHPSWGEAALSMQLLRLIRGYPKP